MSRRSTERTITLVAFTLFLVYLVDISAFKLTPHVIHSFKRSSAPLFASLSDTMSEWYEMEDCLVLVPEEKVARAVIHFVGGFAAGSSIPIAYSSVLSMLCNKGYLVVATPTPLLELNHGVIAETITRNFIRCYNNRIKPILGSASDEVPVIGLSHSLGAKLTVLMCSTAKNRKLLPNRYANVFLAFNNYGASESFEYTREQAALVASPELKKVFNSINIPNIKKLLDGVSNFATDENVQEFVKSSPFKEVPMFNVLLSNAFAQAKDSLKDYSKKLDDLEFQPSPEATWKLLLENYQIQQNFLFQFRSDKIDQSDLAAALMRQKGLEAKLLELPGNHLTPNAQLSNDVFTDLLGFLQDDDGKMTKTKNYKNSELSVNLESDSDVVVFSRNLLGVLNKISDDAWDKVYEKRANQYSLPADTQNL